MFENPDTEIDAFTMHLGFDTGMLNYVSCVEGTLPPGGWVLFDCNEATSGDVTIGAFSLNPIPTGSSGVLVTLTFDVDCPACMQGDTSALTVISLADDLELFGSVNGTFTYDCGSQPTATPTEPGPTNTPEPTNTPVATNTPGPTSTPITGDTIAISDAAGCNGDFITVDVLFSNETTDIDAFTMHLGFDPAMLSYVSCVEGTVPPGGWVLFDCNEATSGDVTIGAFALDPIPMGSTGTLATLTFEVDCPACMEGDMSALTVLSLADDIAGFASDNGTFTYDCGGQPTATPTEPGPTATPTSVQPTNTPAPGDFLVVSDVSGENGDSVVVQIQMNNAETPVDAFTMHLGFDTDMLVYQSCTEGALVPPGGWVLFDCNESAPGDITIGGFSLDPIPAGGNGILVELTFTVDCAGCVQGDTSILAITDLADDIDLFDTYDGTFTYGQGGQPT
ncbi:MAG TPA: cohesin domain-containing protein, partial [bacterium]|nr:cohesin domain-containing protein [bacterium]